jgi:hypothetical protein
MMLFVFPWGLRVSIFESYYFHFELRDNDALLGACGFQSSTRQSLLETTSSSLLHVAGGGLHIVEVYVILSPRMLLLLPKSFIQ